MNRFSVLYTLKDHYYHIGAADHAQAQALLRKLAADGRRKAIGIYDSKTELFAWEPTIQQDYDQASISEQGARGGQIIAIAQELRRRDASWRPSTQFQRPNFFA